MKPDEIRKLLGGYATGTLTDEERQALLTAALDDQQLFDALADEEALRELLSEETYRRSLVQELDERPATPGERLAAWWRRPAPLALAGAFAMAAVILFIVGQQEHPGTQTTELAMNREAPAAESVARDEPPPAKPAAAAPKQEAATPPEEPVGEPLKDVDQVLGVTLAEGQSVAPEREQKEEMEVASVPPPAPERAKKISEPKGTFRGDVSADSLADRANEADEAPAMAMAQAAPPTRPLPAGLAGAPPSPASPLVSRQVRRAPAAVSLEETRADVGKMKTAAAVSVENVFLCRVQRRAGDADFADAAPYETLAVSDDVRFRVESGAAGHIYVVETGTAAGDRLIFSGEVGAGVTFVPPSGGLAPAQQAGRRTLVVLFSESPLPVSALGIGGPVDRSAASSVQEYTLNYH